jgi:hypothetical protein
VPPSGGQKAKPRSTNVVCLQEIEGYLSTLDTVASAAKMQYETMQNNVASMIDLLRKYESRGKRVNWDEIRSLQKEAEALALAGKYEDAGNKAIDTFIS